MGKANILLVEDDESLGFVVKDSLESSGYTLTLCENGQSGYEAFLRTNYDLCLLDVMLPKKDGFTLAGDIRKINEQIPIIFLTAKSMIEDKVEGFRKGGDDYITKPFNMQELLLRVEAVLKRQQREAEQANGKRVFQLGAYEFDHKTLELKHPTGNRSLTRKEAELLRLLCLKQDEVLERDLALRTVWGNDDYFLGRSMDVFITKLRKYLKLDSSIEIQNVHGVGFKLAVKK